MSAPTLGRARPSSSRIRAIAVLRIRRLMRTRLALAAAVLALLPWLLVESHALLPRLASLTEFSLVGLTVAAAGAIADDLDSGEYAITLTHDTSSLEVLAGQALASLALTVGLVAVALPIALSGTAVPSALAVMQSLAWLLALLLAWLSLAMLFGTLLDGKANAMAMGALLVLVPLLSGPGLLDRLPSAVAAAVRSTLQFLPQASQATAMFRGALGEAPSGALVPAVLVASPVLYFLLAAIRLARLEPAGRLTQ